MYQSDHIMYYRNKETHLMMTVKVADSRNKIYLSWEAIPNKLQGDDKMAKCMFCEGKGRIPCPVCGGSKKDIRDSSKNCGYCNGKGYRECDSCNGSGVDPYNK